jgi:hypothetical protein
MNEPVFALASYAAAGPPALRYFTSLMPTALQSGMCKIEFKKFFLGLRLVKEA